MKIDVLKRIIDKAYKNGKGCDVEFYIELSDGYRVVLDIENICQFNVIPDTTITFELKNKGIDIYSKNLGKKELKYKDEYIKLKNKVEKIENILGE